MEATYISNNSFSVEGDRISDFVTNRRLKLDCGIDGTYYASIETSVSGVLTTTVIIDEDILTSNLTTVLYSSVKPGGAGNLPDHFHTNSEGDGGYIAESTYEFIDLTDTPSTYSGTEGQYLQSTGSGTVWATISGGSAIGLSELTDYDFGTNTISGTGDIYCNDVYMGDTKISTSSGTLLVNNSPIEIVAYNEVMPNIATAEVLVVGGGGSGGGGESNPGGDGGGGGGGGAVINEFVTIKPSEIYNITIGSGGAGVAAYAQGNNGGDSYFGALVAKGGGAGAGDVNTEDGNCGKDGGNGGGAASTHVYTVYGGSPYLRGFKGGGSPLSTTIRAGGGGGGANEVGTTPTSHAGAKGGDGYFHPIFGTFGGGGGSGASSTYAIGPGGDGGGGSGATYASDAVAGTPNTGGGGGGGGGNNTGYSASAAGGSGIVIIRYSNEHPAAEVTGSPEYTNSGGYRTYKFTSDGTFNLNTSASSVAFTDFIDTPSTYSGTEGLYAQSTGSGIIWATISGGTGDVTSEDLTTLSGALQTQIDNFEGGGASTFLDLTDTPSTYDGAAGKYLVVTTSGIDFTTIDSQSIIGQATTLTVTGTMSPGDYYSFRVDDKQYNYSFDTTDDFLSFDTNLWYKTSDTALTSITEAKPGLRYFISDQITGNTYKYIRHKLFLEGDYSITLYGTVVNCNYEGSGIEIAINSSSHTSLGYLKAGYSSGSKFMCNFGSYTTATRSNASFALRIIRSGSTIYSKYSDGQTGSFNTLRTDTLSTASHTIVIGMWASASITSDQVVILEKVVLDYSEALTLDPSFETPTISGMITTLASDVSYYSNVDTDYTSDTLSISSNSVFDLSNVVNFDVNTVYNYLTQPNAQYFLDLNDTPSTYSGTEGLFAQSTGSGIVFMHGPVAYWEERTGISGWDFDETTLIRNDAWHVLDLSGIVPDGVTMVHLNIRTQNLSGAYFYFGSGAAPVSGATRFFLTNTSNMQGWDVDLFLSANKEICYSINSNSSFNIDVAVTAWYIDTISEYGVQNLNIPRFFNDLGDVPVTYSGTEGQYLQSTGSGTVWSAISGGGTSDVQSFLDLNDTPSTYFNTAGHFLQSTGSGSNWTPLSVDKGMSELTDYNFGSNTISGTGDIHCNDLYTASNSIYIGDTQLTTDSGTLVVNGKWISGAQGIYTDYGAPHIGLGSEGDYYINKTDQSVYGRYRITSMNVKSIIFDIADNYGNATYLGIRHIAFLYENGLIDLDRNTDFDAYSTTIWTGAYYTYQLFHYEYRDNTDNQLGWVTPFATTNQRVIIVFTDAIIIDEIAISNYHWSGNKTDYGAKNIKIYVSTDDITDTTYNASISNSELVFDGQIPQHVSENITDFQSPELTPPSNLSAWTKVFTVGDKVTKTELSTISGSLKSQMDSLPNSFIALDDTQITYSGGQYLRTTTSGISAIDGIILKAPNDSEWLIKVTNSGTLYTVEV